MITFSVIYSINQSKKNTKTKSHENTKMYITKIKLQPVCKSISVFSEQNHAKREESSFSLSPMS